ncbi:MAG: radical SAM protein [Muribaculaceae bacterium]|nr:radical SAM protein [Muribaculaceae bacterium]
MKISRYISLIGIDNANTLLFNASSSKFVVIRNRVIDNADELYRLAESDPELKNKLNEANVYVDDNVDEIEELKNKIHAADNDNRLFQLNINPTLDCNFRCWYCYENHHKGSFMSAQTIESVVKFIDNTLERLRELEEFHISFFGGEPLIGFDDVARPLIEQVQQLCKAHDVRLSIHFTSNGYLLNEEIISFLSNYRVSFQITLDGDREQHDKTRFSKGGGGSFDKIIENILLLVKHKLWVTVRINYTTQNAESIRDIINYFEECTPEERNCFSFDFHRVWQQRDRKDDMTDEAVAEIKNTFKKKDFAVSTFIHRDVTNSCYGDKTNYVLINYNGEAFGCTARDFVSENRIGMLQPDGTILYDEPVYSERAKAKFKNSVCHECRIAPICGGGCRQRAYESLGAGNRCVYNYDEEDKDAKILDIFYHSFC